VRDYVDDRDLGILDSGTPTLKTAFRNALLLEVSPLSEP
jgi:hypothetical protein